jgi:hypothetical protein
VSAEVNQAKADMYDELNLHVRELEAQNKHLQAAETSKAVIDKELAAMHEVQKVGKALPSSTMFCTFPAFSHACAQFCGTESVLQHLTVGGQHLLASFVGHSRRDSAERSVQDREHRLEILMMDKSYLSRETESLKARLSDCVAERDAFSVQLVEQKTQYEALCQKLLSVCTRCPSLAVDEAGMLRCLMRGLLQMHAILVCHAPLF